MMNFSVRWRGVFAFLAIILLLASCAGAGKEKSTGEYIDDSVITTKVKSALLRSSDVPGINVEVETYKGTVQLSGFVDDEDQLRIAENIAENIGGVKEVINDIEVR